MGTDFRWLQDRLRQRLLAEIAAGELTGLELARQTGFRQAHISNFLNCKRGLSLEAMDEILRARKLTLANLMQGGGKAKARRRALQANSPGISWIPLVDAKNCHASEVPFALGRNALAVMSERLGRMRPQVQVPRPHWQRFVAMRVEASEAWAMAPRLERGAMVVVDRHSNAVEAGAIYVVRRTNPLAARGTSPSKPKDSLIGAPGTQVVMRYIERVGKEYVLRAERREVALETLEDQADVIGRVCMVINIW